MQGKRGRRVFSLGFILAVSALPVASRQLAPIEVTVTEGTSMSVAVSPDGRTLAIDLQGSLWTLPASGGRATRITDVHLDVRQPVWSPDGKWITYFAYADGGYDIWSVAPDGTGAHQLTRGPFDDREPIWSHDGTRVAFSSDRGDPLGSDYNIWTLDVRSGALRQLTKDAEQDFMPTWSPDDREIAFASTRDEGRSVWAVHVETGAERKVAGFTARVDAPSWSAAGEIVHYAAPRGASVLVARGAPVTGQENAFPFRVSWATPTEFFYVSDGRIRRRGVGASPPTTVPFSATLAVTRADYRRRPRDFDGRAPRPALGLVRPVLSPDGSSVAFAALGDIYVMPIGGRPVNVTRDAALDTDPAWSPDGALLAYSSDKGSPHLQIWVRDVKTGRARAITRIATPAQGAAWSPDGRRIAFFNVTGMWRVAEMSVVDVATGVVTVVHETLPQPGAPTWSPDGTRLAIAGVASYSARFREGTNQVLTMSAAAPGSDRWFAPVPTLSIDSRGGSGPVWSPDGSKMAAIYEGVLSVWPVTRAGEPLGPPRRVTSESAHAPSWQGDSRHLLYQHHDVLKIANIETGATRVVPVDLTYALAVPEGRVVVHAGRLVDMTSDAVRREVDVIIAGNRIERVTPHDDRAHRDARVIDASSQTVMPGLVEFHSHLQPDFGEAQGRAWLAFGITTVRSPGGLPYEAVEQREASDAGVRPGPRVFSTGFLMEWMRVYYKMGIAISSPAHLEMELERARILRHDLIKSYVRLPDAQQKRMTDFAHAIGVPVATHEIYPASLWGVDNTEHTAATSRRGYSPKQGPQQRAYEDVIRLFGASGRIFCPMIPAAGTARLLADDPARRTDPRLALYPPWIRQQVERVGPPTAAGPGGAGRMVMDAMRAGALVVAGTDTANGLNLHGELRSYVLAGMTPFEALKTATVNPARALGLEAGTIEAGRLADLAILDGNPLDDISNTLRVRWVMVGGRLFSAAELIAASGALASR